MDLDKLVAKLKKPLRLEDWDIYIEKVRRHEMDRIDNLGQCEVDKQEKIAHVKVLVEDDIPPGVNRTEFYRSTVLHEMLHILAFDGDDDKDEVVVRRVTRILEGFIWPNC